MFELILSMQLLSADYGSAYEQASLEKEPLVIFVSADWCGTCKEVRPRLNKVYGNYVYLDADDDKEKVDKLLKWTKSRSIPQIIMWRKRDGVWSQKFLIGGKTEKEISEFLEIVPLEIPEVK